MKKNDLIQINISDISAELPDLKNTGEAKTTIISKWLINRIKADLASGKIKTGSLLPSKPELAFLLGVSIGTIQNALRIVEDEGCVESKQCIGTLIKDQSSAKTLRKLTTKREIIVETIKKLIKNQNIKIGEKLPSSRTLAKNINSSANTTRLALEYLCREGILECHSSSGNDKFWSLKSLDFETENNLDEQETLVKKIEEDLKSYIDKNLKIGDKIPSHTEFAKLFEVSIKTIHDGLKNLAKEGILLPRRGRYGTSVIKMPYDRTVDAGKETSIFASAKETAFYYYERTQNQIKRMISENYSIGDKLPSIMDLSKAMDLSPNTIRKAFQNLAAEGYLSFSRGRYGGTFVIDIPETETQAFKWLAVNPKYAEVYKN